jgi:hypothetical protein
VLLFLLANKCSGKLWYFFEISSFISRLPLSFYKIVACEREFTSSGPWCCDLIMFWGSNFPLHTHVNLDGTMHACGSRLAHYQNNTCKYFDKGYASRDGKCNFVTLFHQPIKTTCEIKMKTATHKKYRFFCL